MILLKTSNTEIVRRNILLISEVSAYTIALVGLNELWYANYPKSSFHFINDNNELSFDNLIEKYVKEN